MLHAIPESSIITQTGLIEASQHQSLVHDYSGREFLPVNHQKSF
jgi:hypothetical protein